ncbi:MAG: hypothetical protein IJW99_06345 [Clostridia bacterium]|nr:hypothetical protein [Clostridia bacterium]
MKLTKRLLSAALAALLSACVLTSCGAADPNVPEGMQLASLDGVEYALYVPETWTVNKNSGVSGAYVSAYDKSNVSLISYLPTSAMTTEQYFAMCEESYKAEFDNYALVESGSATMADMPAQYYVYTATVGGENYKFLQAIVGNGGMFYNLTYTSLSDMYDSHIEEVMKMIEVFTFR